MNILVTAGNTQVMIDRVRCITNIFSGRTGTNLALHCHSLGHVVTLVTSHLEIVGSLRKPGQSLTRNWRARGYRSFDDLHLLLEELIHRDAPDVVIHCAAVSDYLAAGIFAPAKGTNFDAEQLIWQSNAASPPAVLDVSAGKVKSSEPELWLRLTRAPKLIDLIRSAWGFRGILVKFKLEVGLDEPSLLTIAEASRQQSQADLMVANTLEGAKSWAMLGPLNGDYRRIDRAELPARLLAAIEAVAKEKTNG